MENKSDNIWLELLSLGEEKAYKWLFTQYYSVLGVFAYRFLRDRALCEDVVHDVFLELYQTRERFGNIIALKTYLYNSVRNRCVDLLRHGKVEARYAEELARRDGASFCYNQVLESEVYLILRKVIAELPDPVRIVYDYVLQGYNNQEIAEKMGLTEDAVKAHKKRGKKLLRDKLEYLLSLPFISCLFWS